MAKGVHVTGVDLTDSDGNVDVTYNVGDNTFTFTASVSPTDVSAAGSDRQVQFNDAGNLGATSNLTFTEDPSTLGVKYGEFGDPEKNQNPDSFGENIIFTDAYFLNQETDVNGVNGFVEHDFNSSAPTGDRTLTGVSGFASAYRENSEDSGTDLGGFKMIGGEFGTNLPDAQMQRSQALRAQSRTNGSSIDYVTGVTSNVEVVATDVTELKGVEAAISADFSSETDVDRAYGVWVGYAVDTFDFNNDYPNNREDGIDNADRFYGIYVDFEKHSTFKGSLSAGYDPDNPSSPEATLTAKSSGNGKSISALNGSLLVESFDSNSGSYDKIFEVNETGEITKSSGNFDKSLSEADNGKTEYFLNQETDVSGSTTKLLKVDSQDLNTLPSIPENGTWHFKGNVVARVSQAGSNSSVGDTHIWEIEGVVTNTGGTSTRSVGNPSVTTVATDSSIDDFTVNVSLNGNDLEIEVNGDTGDSNNITKWVGNIVIDEVIA